MGHKRVKATESMDTKASRSQTGSRGSRLLVNWPFFFFFVEILHFGLLKPGAYLNTKRPSFANIRILAVITVHRGPPEKLRERHFAFSGALFLVLMAPHQFVTLKWYLHHSPHLKGRLRPLNCASRPRDCQTMCQSSR